MCVLVPRGYLNKQYCNIFLTKSRNNTGYGVTIDKTELSGMAFAGSKRSLAATSLNKLHWRGSAFDIPHNSLIDISNIPPLPESICKSEVPWWTSKRFLLAIICFFGCLVNQAMRVNLSIAIVSMVDDNQDILPANGSSFYNSTTADQNVSFHMKCPATETIQSRRNGEFQWSKYLQGLLLGSLFWGYMVLQVSGGWFCGKYGVKKVLTVTFSLVVVITLISPVCARTSPYLLMGMRVALGLSQCMVYPSMQTLWASWAPPHERSRLFGFSYAGSSVGNAVMFPIGGLLSHYGFDGGWPSVFYVVGIAGFVWTVIWCICTYDSPAVHPNISTIEQHYIEHCLGFRQGLIIKRNPIPWKLIFKSKAVWAIIITHVSSNYGTYMLITQLPTYMKEVLKVDIQSNGVFSMLPYLFLWIITLVSGAIADMLITNGVFSVCNTRKLFTCIGLFLVGASYMNCHQQSAAVVLLTLAVGVSGCFLSGFFINSTDIAPAFAGTILGISNTAATVPGFLAPYVVALLTPNGTAEEWQKTFFLAAGMYLFGAVVYCILGEGEIQPWGHIPYHENEHLEETIVLSPPNMHGTSINEDKERNESK